jgi:hypothetical protein
MSCRDILIGDNFTCELKTYSFKMTARNAKLWNSTSWAHTHRVHQSSLSVQSDCFVSSSGRLNEQTDSEYTCTTCTMYMQCEVHVHVRVGSGCWLLSNCFDTCYAFHRWACFRKSRARRCMKSSTIGPGQMCTLCITVHICSGMLPLSI